MYGMGRFSVFSRTSRAGGLFGQRNLSTKELATSILSDTTSNISKKILDTAKEKAAANKKDGFVVLGDLIREVGKGIGPTENKIGRAHV